MAYLLLTCQVVLAIIFLLAATGKILHTEQFAATLRLSHLPGAVVQFISVLIPILELVLAATLVLSTARSLTVTMVAALVLLSVFTIWMIWVYARGLRLTCSCFGASGSDVGLRSITRNGVLIVVAAIGVFLSTHALSPFPSSSLWMSVTIGSVGMAIMLFLAFRQGVKVLTLSMQELVNAQATKSEQG